MIYLDYASHTNIDTDILQAMIEDAKNYPISVNSLYQGENSGFDKYNEYVNNLKKITTLLDYDFVLTSSASESNNLAIKGCAMSYKGFGKHIISTPYEHSSISGSLNYLVAQGFQVDYVDIDENGFIDVSSLKKLLKENTILVTFASVNSETGHIQDLENLAKIIKSYPNALIHVDATQSFGKLNINYDCADFISFSAHKLYGPTSGCGGLFVRHNKLLTPQIDGGKSMTPFRSSTPDLIMMGAMYRACEKLFRNIDTNYTYVKNLQTKLLNFINTNNFAINSDLNNPFILNISTNKNGISIQENLAKKGIFISTKSSCSAKASIPKSVYAIYNDRLRAKNSIRISLSHKTSSNDVDSFIKILGEINEQTN